jgi:hypothetical protein
MVKTQTLIETFLDVRKSIAILDVYQQKELTETPGSYSHRFQREGDFQIEDSIKFSEGTLKIITVISKERPYTEEKISINFNEELVLEGGLFFEQADLRSDVRNLKEFRCVFSRDIDWRSELELLQAHLLREVHFFIEAKIARQDEIRKNRIERKRNGKK